MYGFNSSLNVKRDVIPDNSFDSLLVNGDLLCGLINRNL